MKKFSIFLVACLAVCLGIFWLARENQSSFSPDYTLSLPDGIVLQSDDKTANGTLLRDGEIIGGVLNCPYSREVLDSPEFVQIHSANFHMYSETILSTLEAAGAPGGDLSSFDHMMESSPYTDCEVWLGNPEREYEHFLYFFEDGILSLWLDLSLVDNEAAQDIAANFSVTR